MDADISPLKRLFKPWVFVGALIFACVLLAATLGAFWLLRPVAQAKGQPTAVIYVIAAPTNTLPAPTAAPQPTATPTQAMPTPPPGVIAVGAFVQVTGTSGDGLRLRSEPGLNSKILFLGVDTEVFQVKDGPKEIDGYTWWYLVAPFDDTHHGWAVANYLAVIQNP